MHQLKIDCFKEFINTQLKKQRNIQGITKKKQILSRIKEAVFLNCELIDDLR
jgi:hypothetical protein